MKIGKVTYRMIWMNGVVVLLWLAALAVVALMLTGCERRELYVYGSEFHSVSLSVDWHEYQDKDPDGMTTWFWPLADSDIPTGQQPYTFTTSQVRHYDLYLQSGRYRGVVIDYSPAEYGRQVFTDMTNMQQARVVAALDAHQPDRNTPAATDLYGAAAYATELPYKNDETGFYEVLCQPEMMAQDTLKDMQVVAGEYGDYIPYAERDEYQQSLHVKEFRATPQRLVWNMQLRIAVQGINNLTTVESTIAGLSDGHLLALDKNTDTPCMVRTDNWNIVRTDQEGNGYIEATVSTFGLRPSSVVENTPPAANNMRRAQNAHMVIADGEVRLNLHFVLRDGATTLIYHYDVGTHVAEYDNEHLLLLRLDPEDFGDGEGQVGPPIVLPYVEPKDGAGFGADVTPWDEGGQAEVPM